MAGAASPLLAELRKSDPDRYLSVLYAPADKREALAALYLFNSEIAAIRDRIHEPMPGEIRIQWWRDTLSAGNSETAGHPVAAALLRVIKEYRLPLAAFDNYLEARIFDLYDDPMPSRSDLEGYCGETASAIIQLAAVILDADAAPGYASAAGHAGCAQAITGLLRLTPLHRSRGQCYVPTEILTAVGTSRDEFVAAQNREAAKNAVAAMAALARDHFEEFRNEAKGLPSSLRAAFLPATLAPLYLDKIAASSFDPLEKVAEVGAVRKHFRLLTSAARRW
mgnify:CR=1 FL=1